MTAIYAWATAEKAVLAADDKGFVGLGQFRETCARKITALGKRYAIAICGSDVPMFPLDVLEDFSGIEGTAAVANVQGLLGIVYPIIREYAQELRRGGRLDGAAEASHAVIMDAEETRFIMSRSGRRRKGSPRQFLPLSSWPAIGCIYLRSPHGLTAGECTPTSIYPRCSVVMTLELLMSGCARVCVATTKHCRRKPNFTSGASGRELVPWTAVSRCTSGFHQSTTCEPRWVASLPRHQPPGTNEIARSSFLAECSVARRR